MLINEFFITILFLGNNFLGIYSGRNEKRLLKKFFDENRQDAHDIMERPIANESEPIEVTTSVHLLQLIDVDEKNEMIEMNIWLQMEWKDYHFKWDPQSYNGIKRINIPSPKLWKPDIVLFNRADDKGLVSENIQVHHNSIMKWSPLAILKATCDIDVTWFPFDQQNCYLKFGSWTYSGEDIDLKLACIDVYGTKDYKDCADKGFSIIEKFKRNSEFNLIDHTLIRKKYSFGNETYVNIYVNIGIQRISLYYISNFISPCILISMISTLVFILPPDSGEKISLGVTVLLAMTMFLLLVADKLPQSANAVPLICKYFLAVMFLCSLSIISTVIVLNCHYQSARYKAVNTWIKILINRWLAKVIFMKMDDYPIRKKDSLTWKTVPPKPPALHHTREPWVCNHSVTYLMLLPRAKATQCSVITTVFHQYVHHHRNVVIGFRIYTVLGVKPLGGSGSHFHTGPFH